MFPNGSPPQLPKKLVQAALRRLSNGEPIPSVTHSLLAQLSPPAPDVPGEPPQPASDLSQAIIPATEDEFTRLAARLTQQIWLTKLECALLKQLIQLVVKRN